MQSTGVMRDAATIVYFAAEADTPGRLLCRSGEPRDKNSQLLLPQGHELWVTS